MNNYIHDSHTPLLECPASGLTAEVIDRLALDRPDSPFAFAEVRAIFQRRQAVGPERS
jgi:hypothetical protein